MKDTNTVIEKRRGKLQRFFILWLPLLCYMILIFLLSSGPGPEDIPDIWNIDKLLHLGAYSILGILWFRALQGSSQKRRKTGLIFLSFLFTTLYGISDEIHQSFVPLREASVGDVVADGLGAYLGPYLYSKAFL